MKDNAPPDVNFLEWFGTLNDEEQAVVYKRLCKVAEELGCGINEDPFVTKEFLNLGPHTFTMLSLN